MNQPLPIVRRPPSLMESHLASLTSKYGCSTLLEKPLIPKPQIIPAQHPEKDTPVVGPPALKKPSYMVSDKPKFNI